MMPPRYAQTFTVKYTDENCKRYAIDVLNVIDGIVAENENDKKSGLATDVFVSVTRSRDLEATEKILKLFGSSVHKKSVFKVTFVGNTENALSEVKKLEGVVQAIWLSVSIIDRTIYAPSTLIVLGNADPAIVLTTLQKYGKACIYR